MKRISILLIIVLCIFVTGCTKNNGELVINCNGVESTTKITKGNLITCELLKDNYIFEIKKIKKDKVIIKTNKSGLFKQRKDGTISLVDDQKEFIIEKNKKNVIMTQSTDYQESMIVEWK